VRADLRQIADVADMVAFPVLVHRRDLHLPAEALLRAIDGLEDRNAVGPPPAEVVDLARTRILEEGMEQAADVLRMDVVSNLLPLVAVDPVLAALGAGSHHVREKAVELRCTVGCTGKAPPAEAGGAHAEVASVLLHHDVCGDLARTEEAVLALVDAHRLGDSAVMLRQRVVPARLELDERQLVGRIPVDLVRAEEAEHDLGPVQRHASSRFNVPTA